MQGCVRCFFVYVKIKRGGCGGRPVPLYLIRGAYLKRAENVLLEQVCQWTQMFQQESGFLTGIQEDVHIQGVTEHKRIFLFCGKEKKMC